MTTGGKSDNSGLDKCFYESLVLVPKKYTNNLCSLVVTLFIGLPFLFTMFMYLCFVKGRSSITYMQNFQDF